MRFFAFFLLLALAAPSAEIRYFRYERPVENAPQHAGQTCLALDSAVFAHAAPQLADLRLYRGGTETPYVLQTAAPVVAAPQQIAPLNLGRRGGETVFDAAMPEGSYSDLQLGVTGRDFIASVSVSGSQSQSSAQTKLGSYTIFDLSRQRLGRSTVLHLPQSDFRFLHFRIAGPLLPDSVAGLSIERRPVGEAKYLTVAESSRVESSRLVEQGRASVIEFAVPRNVPVDRITFVPGAEPPSFSRDVEVRVAPIPPPATAADDAAEPPQTAASFGNLLRVHRAENGHRIDEEQLSVEAPWQAASAPFDTPAKWTIKIENGDDAAIQLASVRLEMLERNLCFEAAGGAVYTLYYGDSALAMPHYDYAALFMPESHAAQGKPGPETLNPVYQPRPDERPFTERHPVLLWVALALVIALLAGVAFRSVKRTAPADS
jgi:hypothetical protein